jgi:flagellar hook-basal body protein
MQRALFSGVSGLTNHQTLLDVSANNLANVSTPGFKGSRNTFSTTLLQTSFAGTSPGSSVGGVNPRQVGLGVQLASTDVDMRQGALQATGRNLDLAIQGQGFFQVSNGERTLYTRVGNFGFDSDSNLVDLSSGNRLVGNVYGEGSDSTPVAFNVPVSIPNGAAIQSKRTSEVTMQGNLSAVSASIQGRSTQSLFPLVDATSNETATDDTQLKNLTIFKGAIDPGAGAGQMRVVHMFGSKPDGTGWTGDIAVNVWRDKVSDLVDKMNAVLVDSNIRFGSVSLDNGNLVSSAVGIGDGFSMFMGDAGTSGTSNEVTPTTDIAGVPGTGNLTGVVNYASPSVTTPLTALATDWTTANVSARVVGTFTIPAGTTIASAMTVNILNGANAVVGTVSVPAGTYAAATSFTVPTTTLVAQSDSIRFQFAGPAAAVNGITYSSTIEGGLTDDSGYAYTGTGLTQALAAEPISRVMTGATPTEVRVQPTFVMPANDYSGSSFVSKTMTVTVRDTTANVVLGTVTIPAADYSDPSVGRTFTLASLPRVDRTHNIQYEVAGDLDLTNAGAIPGANLTWSTNFIDPTATDNMVGDTDNDGQLNMYDTSTVGVAFDPSAWQYSDASNGMFNWYRSRFVPEIRTSSVEIYDFLGGKHVLEMRMFRNGTKPDPTDSTAKRNSWDIVVGIKADEGTVVDDLISGVEFDQKGRYTGEYGRTLKGNSLADIGFAGDPSSRTIRVDWNATGTTSPSTIDISLGTPSGVDGLTGFGSASTAAATKQDGYADGKLDTLSVSAGGDIVGLFTNGVAKKLAQIQLATFQNPNGLINAGGNLWIDSPNSGTSTLRDAGQGGAGTIASGSLEGSNVDIATEFTRLITAQRGFQVNARVIQTTDSVLQELASLIRG